MVLEWSLALFGIVYKIFSTNRYGLFSMVLYLAMGWLTGAVVEPMAAVAPAGCVTLFVMGGHATWSAWCSSPGNGCPTTTLSGTCSSSPAACATSWRWRCTFEAGRAIYHAFRRL